MAKSDVKLIDAAGITDGFVVTASSSLATWAAAGAAGDTTNDPYAIFNCGLEASVAASALTVTLQQRDLTDPTAGNPVKIAFKNSTLATGNYILQEATSALTVVVPSGATLNHQDAETKYLYVYAIDNSGTVELAVSSNFRLDETQLHSSTTISGTADLEGGFYSTTGRTNVPVRLIGQILSNQTTAGTWASAPTEVTVSNKSLVNYQGKEFEDYTPTGFWTVNVTYDGTWRRVGNMMTLYAVLETSGVPGAGGDLFIDMPLGYLTDDAQPDAAGSRMLTYGHGRMRDASTGEVFFLHINRKDSNSMAVRFLESGTNGRTDQVEFDTPFAFAAGDAVHINCEIPIVGWGTSVQT